MSRIQRIIFAVAIAITVSITLGYILVNYTGWKQFSMKNGENFQMNEMDSTNVDKLKFKDCIFTAPTTTANVTSVLNGMARAYKGNTNSQYVFKLDDPGLSPYSFQIPKFNDKDTRPSDPDTKVTLTGYYKLLK